MATGTVYYWNGKSGWIKRDGVSDEPTDDAWDLMLLAEDISSGTVDQNCSVSFDDPTCGDWRARNIVVQ